MAADPVAWHEFDYQHKKRKPAPPVDELVWIMEDERGVTVGYFDGFTFRLWHGTDDCSVTHWAPISYPAKP